MVVQRKLRRKDAQGEALFLGRVLIRQIKLHLLQGC